MKFFLAYRFALDPNDLQSSQLASHCGAARFAFNWGLALVKQRLDGKQAGSSRRAWNLAALRWEWNRAKESVAPWWAQNSKEAYNSGLDALARALSNWAASKRGLRAGARKGFPRFRCRRGNRESCRFGTGAIHVLRDGKHIQLPRIGAIRTHERTTALLASVARGRARILSATVSREVGRWYVSFGCEVILDDHRPARPPSVIGVDVGIHRLAVFSTGHVIPNPRYLERSLSLLRRACRRVARRQIGSRRREQARRRLSRLHARVRHQRTDALHKLTTALVREHSTIVVERLNLAGMIRNRRMARVLSDTGMGEIRRQLTYKTAWYGRRLVTADPFYPSSKTCSRCGWVKAKLSLGDRRFVCEHCHVSLDRDYNAARNLARLAEPVTGSAPGTLTARGGEHRTKASALAAAMETGTEPPARLASVSEPAGTTGGRILGNPRIDANGLTNAPFSSKGGEGEKGSAGKGTTGHSLRSSAPSNGH